MASLSRVPSSDPLRSRPSETPVTGPKFWAFKPAQEGQPANWHNSDGSLAVLKIITVSALALAAITLLACGLFFGITQIVAGVTSLGALLGLSGTAATATGFGLVAGGGVALGALCLCSDKIRDVWNQHPTFKNVVLEIPRYAASIGSGILSLVCLVAFAVLKAVKILWRYGVMGVLTGLAYIGTGGAVGFTLKRKVVDNGDIVKGRPIVGYFNCLRSEFKALPKTTAEVLDKTDKAFDPNRDWMTTLVFEGALNLYNDGMKAFFANTYLRAGIRKIPPLRMPSVSRKESDAHLKPGDEGDKNTPLAESVEDPRDDKK